MGELHMDASYDRVSAPQRSLGEPLVRYLSSSLQSYREAESVAIADLGCATGGNSLKIFTPLLQKFRAQSRAQVLVFHTDLPGNEWNLLFESLQASPESYYHVENVHSFVVGKSFYTQCFPNNSLDIAYASCAFHWLSRPSEGRNQLYPLLLKFDDYETNLPQRMREDLSTILTHRYAELRPGGHLMFNVPQFSPRDGMPCPPWSKWRIRCETVNFYPSFVESFRYPFGFNTFQGTLNIISDFSPAFKIVSHQEIDQESSIYKTFRETGDVVRFAAEMKGFFKGILHPYLLSLFKGEAGGEAKVNQYFDKVEEHLSPRAYAPRSRLLPPSETRYERLILT